MCVHMCVCVRVRVRVRVCVCLRACVGMRVRRARCWNQTRDAIIVELERGQ
jgi:hypothetical protein